MDLPVKGSQRPCRGLRIHSGKRSICTICFIMDDGGTEVRPTCPLAPKYLSNNSSFLEYISFRKVVDAAAKSNHTKNNHYSFSFRYLRDRYTILGVP